MSRLKKKENTSQEYRGEREGILKRFRESVVFISVDGKTRKDPNKTINFDLSQPILDVEWDVELAKELVSRRIFDSRLNSRNKIDQSGVWRFREIVHPLLNDDEIITRPEGRTNLYSHKRLSEYTGVKNVQVKAEGENPTSSFKDRGITVIISEARRLGMDTVACASTGNTSAAVPAYASMCGMKSLDFIPEGNIAFGKLAQAMAYGAKVLQVKGNFDEALTLVRIVCREFGIYLANSVNPWRIEGQKTISLDILQQLSWETPDWIVLPGGGLGNTAAQCKGLIELFELGIIDKIPRVASIQAHGANPFYSMRCKGSNTLVPVQSPETIATAIRIGNPASWQRVMKVFERVKGVCEEVTDQEIMDGKAIVDGCGIGCEPASAASVAGLKKLKEKGIIKEDESAVCILTGNILKDPNATVNYHKGELGGIAPLFANEPKVVEANLEAIKRELKI